MTITMQQNAIKNSYAMTVILPANMLQNCLQICSSFRDIIPSLNTSSRPC